MVESGSRQSIANPEGQVVIPELTEVEAAALQYTATQTAIGCMQILHEGQQAGANKGAAAKNEGVLTRYDLLSEDHARINLKRFGPNIPILGEEKGLGDGLQTGPKDPEKLKDYEKEIAEVLAKLEDRILWIVDPLDGSRPYANGAGTSTTIVSAWDKARKQFVATTVGHPQSGTLVEGLNGRTYRSEYDYKTGEQSLPTRCRVWEPKGGMHADSSSLTLLMDNFQPFPYAKPATNLEEQEKRTKPQVFTKEDLARLQYLVSPDMAMLGMGSNGFHFAMLAMGGERLGGLIMNSIGNPGDAAGLHLVENAEGFTRAYRVNAKRELVEVNNPHDIIDDPEHPTTNSNYQIAIAGATLEVADFVTDALRRAFNRQLGVTI